MKTTFIATVLNEEEGIEDFINSLNNQTIKVSEVIIVDAGSIDKTKKIIKGFKNIKLFTKRGNRSVGRNYAINKSKNDIIVVSDSGCILDKKFVENIISPFKNLKIDVVSGYYYPLTTNVFEKCLAAYTCVMPDKINKKDFLPSSRSIAFKKSAWHRVDGYPEYLDTCEDIVFASKMKKLGLNFYFKKNAFVWWRQQKNFTKAWKQFYNYAKGDGKALFIRHQTPLLFFRYIALLVLLLYLFIFHDLKIVVFLSIATILYITWSILKNYRYINKSIAIFYLPILQLISDTAVILGMISGMVERLTDFLYFNKRKIFRENGGYSQIALRNILWVGSQRALIRILTLGRVVVLARILSPGQLGAYGIITFVLSFTEILTETGINVFLIQQNKQYKKYLDTAWIVSILRGILIGGIILLSIPLITSFFDIKSISYLLLLSVLVPLIRGFINPAVIIFQKELDLKGEFNFRAIISLIETISIILLALVTRSEIALLLGMIISTICEAFLSFIMVKVTPKFKISWKYFAKIIHGGKWITTAGITNYLFQNSDDIVVGKILGTYSLGLYQTAYKISIFPITEISDVIARVAFPVFIKISMDKNRLKKAFYKLMIIVSILSLGFGVIIISFTNEIVLLVLGSKWLGITPFLKILTVFGVIRGITGATSILMLAVKKQKYISIITSLSFLGLICTILPLVSLYGLIGVSYSVVIASIIVIPLIVYYTRKILY